LLTYFRPHFLAHARRARHKRTFSEDDRIQAQENVKKVEDEDSGEISEPEDPLMLSRDAKDWKVRLLDYMSIYNWIKSCEWFWSIYLPCSGQEIL